jgi:hypothetical protein
MRAYGVEPMQLNSDKKFCEDLIRCPCSWIIKSSWLKLNSRENLCLLEIYPLIKSCTCRRSITIAHELIYITCYLHAWALGQYIIGLP